MAIPSNALHPTNTPAIEAYLAELAGESTDPLLARMEAHAASTGFPTIGRASGRWLAQLTRIAGGRRVFEIGSGYGYSAWFFAQAVGPEGEVIGSDDNPAHLQRHRDLWEGHPLASRVDLRLGRGRAVLASTSGAFDLVLIDSTKAEYEADFEAALDRLRPGGLVLVDNVLWGGRVTVPSADPTTIAIQHFNTRLFADTRIDVCVLPVGDGLAVARKI